jgi:shikimate kinase
MSREELVAFIDETLNKRNKFYTQAKYQIIQPDIELEEVKAMIAN